MTGDTKETKTNYYGIYFLKMSHLTLARGYGTYLNGTLTLSLAYPSLSRAVRRV